jgi:hypothetical protein
VGTVLSAKLLGFDSEAVPMRFLSLVITIIFAITVLAGLDTGIGPIVE